MMPDALRLALAQLNPAVGDIRGNASKLRAARAEAGRQGAHLLMTSELYLCGYPPEDLVLKPSFQKALQIEAETLARETADGGPAVLVGMPWRDDDGLYNALVLLAEGRVAGKIFKCDLPNYGPFDEKRVFVSAAVPEPFIFRGRKLGALICEDMWTSCAANHLKMAGAEILLVPNGSPYEANKFLQRQKLAQQRVAETGLPLVYLNQVGGQDELVFDGSSFVMNARGEAVAHIDPWVEKLTCIDLDAIDKLPVSFPASPNPESTTYNALMLGLRDYVNKNGFKRVILGLSGGIDSALVALLAVDALGSERVETVMLPSPYTSAESFEDAEQLAKAAACKHSIIPITDAMKAFDKLLANDFSGRPSDTTEENIQARCRGIILMALSNKFGPMVLSTGNKSEMSVGYSTLYGDLCGGFAVLKDLYKTQVYKVSRWRNSHRPVGALAPDGAIIPERIFTKAPTAELKPDQKDQDSLPPYDVLDDILEGLIEQDLSVEDIVARGHDPETVRRVWKMLDTAEYKRRQAPPGVKVTTRHLGKDRRYPITNRYRGDI